ncbi:C6 transcription factor [Aspergillus luchuensis]|uniref:C6 transcription factor n=1 Tax=Aspergillus kawachii TaxID=1069201 RepID=A0A146FDD0_ASPKA|nr:C6 transcription factor [Aspergillus luchuensis]
MNALDKSQTEDAIEALIKSFPATRIGRNGLNTPASIKVGEDGKINNGVVGLATGSAEASGKPAPLGMEPGDLASAVDRALVPARSISSPPQQPVVRTQLKLTIRQV